MSPAAERKSASWGHAPSRVETSPDTVSTAKARALEPAKSTRPVTVFKRQSWAVISERLTGPEFVSTSTSWALPPCQWIAPDTVEAFTFTPLNPAKSTSPEREETRAVSAVKPFTFIFPWAFPQENSSSWEAMFWGTSTTRRFCQFCSPPRGSRPPSQAISKAPPEKDRESISPASRGRLAYSVTVTTGPSPTRTSTGPLPH